MSITLFSTNYPIFVPNFITQGNLNNCWLISTLIALSIKDKGRNIVKGLFKINNEDNTYIIKLFDTNRKLQYIKVTPSFRLNNTSNELMGCGNGLGIPALFKLSPDLEYIWAAIIEKAIINLIGNDTKHYSYYAFLYLTGNIIINRIYSYGLNSRILSKINKIQDDICCTIETNNKTTKLQKNHGYVLKYIKDNIWYLHNPHYSINNTLGSISLDETELIHNIDVITYIIL